MWKTAAILTLVFAGTAFAQSKTTAREQATICANVAEHSVDTADSAMDGACIGTFFGWVTVIDSLSVLTPDRSKQFHIKRPGVNVDVLIRAYCKYVKNHPEIADQQCLHVFILAMLDANLITQERL
jgi:hypothetical protein